MSDTQVFRPEEYIIDYVPVIRKVRSGPETVIFSRENLLKYNATQLSGMLKGTVPVEGDVYHK